MSLARFPNVDILTPGISDTVPFGMNKSGRQIFILTSISVHLKPAPHPGQPSECLLSPANTDLQMCVVFQAWSSSPVQYRGRGQECQRRLRFVDPNSRLGEPSGLAWLDALQKLFQGHIETCANQMN